MRIWCWGAVLSIGLLSVLCLGFADEAAAKIVSAKLVSCSWEGPAGGAYQAGTKLSVIADVVSDAAPEDVTANFFSTGTNGNGTNVFGGTISANGRYSFTGQIFVTGVPTSTAMDLGFPGQWSVRDLSEIGSNLIREPMQH